MEFHEIANILPWRKGLFHPWRKTLQKVAARFRDYYDRQAKERMAEGRRQKSGVENLPHPIEGTCKARDAAGKEFGVSGKSVDHATRQSEAEGRISQNQIGMSLSMAMFMKA